MTCFLVVNNYINRINSLYILFQQVTIPHYLATKVEEDINKSK